MAWWWDWCGNTNSEKFAIAEASKLEFLELALGEWRLIQPILRRLQYRSRYRLMRTKDTTLDQLHNVGFLFNTRIFVKNKTVALDERVRSSRKNAGLIVRQTVPD